MRRPASTLLAAALSAGLACTPAGPVARTSPPAGTAPDAATSRTTTAPRNGEQNLEAQLLEASNRARSAEGLPAMVGRQELDLVAAEHAAELAERRMLDHHSVRWGKRTLVERLDREYTLRSAAENLASVESEETLVARRAITLWLRSEGHRINLLDARYTHSGVGIARGEDGYWYVVQLYAVYY